MFRRTTGKALKVAVVQKISVMNYQGALAIRTNQLLNFKTFFWLQNNRFIVEILENANKIRKEKKLPLTPSSTQITPIMCIYTSFCFFLCVEPPLILIYKKWIFTFFHLNHAYLYQTHTFLYINIVRYSESCSVMSNSLWPHGLYSPWNSLGQNTGVGSHSLPQGIFPTQESNPGLPHCRRTVYRLSHRWSPYIITHNYVYIQICNWGTTDTEHYIRFRCTMLWFDICTYCEMITIGLPNTC